VEHHLRLEAVAIVVSVEAKELLPAIAQVEVVVNVLHEALRHLPGAGAAEL
jgi:hypothetical protein